MTLQLRKKHRTTRLSILPATNLDYSARLGRLFACGAALILLSNPALAATDSSSSLKWGRPSKTSKRTSSSDNHIAQPGRRTRVIRDAQVIAAAWDEADEFEIQQAEARGHSVVVQRSRRTYDPFDEDDRLAQLPEDPADDPFDEPVGESIPVPEPEDEPEEDINAAQQAIEDEIKRRQSADELLEEPIEDMLEPETIEDTETSDPFDDDLDDLTKDFDNQDNMLLQSEDDDWRTPDEAELTSEELRQRSEELQREREESEANCREELAELESDTISSIDLSIRVEGNAGEDFPYECSVVSKRHEPRQWAQITYNWKASALCHKPLYFEQVQLERYGHSWGPFAQPIMSGVHFFSSIPILPYKMGIRTPTECVYSLGYYRPGSCAPYMIDPVPFTWRAAMFEGAAATGISFIIP